MVGVLMGFIVIEVEGEIAAPVAGMLLADNGAEVTKVESPGGDPFRVLLGARVWNRGKKSLALDIRRAPGRAAINRLLSQADALITGLQLEELRSLGLDAPSLRKEFPKLVVCNVTGYGPDGRDRKRPGYGALVEAHMGLQHQQPGPRPGPHYLGFATASYSAAMLATLGVVTALYKREKTGHGQGVDVSLKDGVLGMMTMNWALAEKALPLTTGGAFHKKRLLVQNFQCEDGEWLHLHTGAVGAFERLMGAMELTQYVNRPFADEHEWDQMVAQVEELFAARGRDEWLKVLEKADVPSLPILRHGEALLDEQSEVMGFVQRVNDPELGQLSEVGPPLIFEKTPGAIRSSAPRVGEHTEEILRRIGTTETEIEDLRVQGII